MASSRVPSNSVDHVGSLKRPPELMAAWHDWENGKLTADKLREVQDRAIRDVVAMQELLGLPIVTDGEFRRGGWSRGFLMRLKASSFAPPSSASGTMTVFQRRRRHRSRPSTSTHQTDRQRRLQVHQIGRDRPGQGDHADAFAHAFRSVQGCGRSKNLPQRRKLLGRLDRGYQQEIKDLYAAGCRYLQLDEVPLALLCDKNIRALAKSEGDDPDQLAATYIDVLNRAIAGRPVDMTIGMHLCRGNMEGLWMGDGGYGPIAEALFTRSDVDAYLLEYYLPRAGDFAPLRHLPAGKRAYLGIISTKNPALELPDDLMRRIEDAARFAPMERLGICPQCGFASAAMSKFAVLPSKLTADTQTLKIELLVDVGRRAWGHV